MTGIDPTRAARRRVAVLGATGMLGSMVSQVLRRHGAKVLQTQHQRADEAGYLSAMSTALELEGALARLGAVDLIVNCVGVTRVDRLPVECFRHAVLVNGMFPHELAAASRAATRVLHVSTDGVFRGRIRPYLEDSPTDAEDPYGLTKRLGESVDAPHFLAVRCSIVGPPGRTASGLLAWLLSQPADAEIPGFTNHIWNGVTTLQLAQLAAFLADPAEFARLRERTPVLHFSPNAPISKHDLLREFARVFRPDVHVRADTAPQPVTRILRSRYERVLGIGTQRRPMANAVAELAAFTHSTELR